MAAQRPLPRSVEVLLLALRASCGTGGRCAMFPEWADHVWIGNNVVTALACSSTSAAPALRRLRRSSPQACVATTSPP